MSKQPFRGITEPIDTFVPVLTKFAVPVPSSYVSGHFCQVSFLGLTANDRFPCQVLKREISMNLESLLLAAVDWNGYANGAIYGALIGGGIGLVYKYCFGGPGRQA